MHGEFCSFLISYFAFTSLLPTKVAIRNFHSLKKLLFALQFQVLLVGMDVQTR